ncbi:MAG: DUF1614 domain-containing protein [Bradyrhizobiaceae bacterium]|nr:DUF1614 domain-containing protein [Bradyrhizobiaceae bacterium]
MGDTQFYLPITAPFFIILAALFALLVVLIEVNILRYTYARLGVSSGTAYLLLLASLIGSYINIPVWEFPERVGRTTAEVVTYYGVNYVVPVLEQFPGTVVAVNVGGALIPTVLSLYLLARNDLWFPGILTTAVVTAVVHWMAEPVQGVGIAVPIFVPPVVAALAAVLFASQRAAAVAYVGGSLGTLIGADLLNLSAVRGLGSPFASIGGAGTFDGIFLTGVVAVLLASLSRRA